MRRNGQHIYQNTFLLLPHTTYLPDSITNGRPSWLFAGVVIRKRTNGGNEYSAIALVYKQHRRRNKKKGRKCIAGSWRTYKNDARIPNGDPQWDTCVYWLHYCRKIYINCHDCIDVRYLSYRGNTSACGSGDDRYNRAPSCITTWKIH